MTLTIWNVYFLKKKNIYELSVIQKMWSSSKKCAKNSLIIKIKTDDFFATKSNISQEPAFYYQKMTPDVQDLFTIKVGLKVCKNSLIKNKNGFFRVQIEHFYWIADNSCLNKRSIFEHSYVSYDKRQKSCTLICYYVGFTVSDVSDF